MNIEDISEYMPEDMTHKVLAVIKHIKDSTMDMHKDVGRRMSILDVFVKACKAADAFCEKPSDETYQSFALCVEQCRKAVEAMSDNK